MISRQFATKKMKKIKIKINKLVYLGFSILEISKLIIYEFWYDFIKPKYKEKQICAIWTHSFIIHIKTEDFYGDIADDVEKRFDTSNYEYNSTECSRPLPIRKNQKDIGLMKDELGGKIMTKLVGLRAKNYSYSIDDDNNAV